MQCHTKPKINTHPSVPILPSRPSALASSAPRCPWSQSADPWEPGAALPPNSWKLSRFQINGFVLLGTLTGIWLLCKATKERGNSRVNFPGEVWDYPRVLMFFRIKLIKPSQAVTFYDFSATQCFFTRVLNYLVDGGWPMWVQATGARQWSRSLWPLPQGTTWHWQEPNATIATILSKCLQYVNQHQ